MKRDIIVIILVSLLIIVGCKSEVAEKSPTKIPQIEEPPEISLTIENKNNQEPTSNIKEFEIIAKKWEFNPSVINVNLGDEVILHITSLDVTHSLAISEFDIDEEFIAGQSTEIRFIADQKGEFIFFCNVFCGTGHGGMNGKLVVT